MYSYLSSVIHPLPKYRSTIWYCCAADLTQHHLKIWTRYSLFWRVPSEHPIVADVRNYKSPFYTRGHFWRHPVFLADNGSSPCETQTRHTAPTPSVNCSRITNIWWPDSAAVQLPPLFSLSFIALVSVFDSSQATPSVLLWLLLFLTFCNAFRKTHILYILHESISNKIPKTALNIFSVVVSDLNHAISDLFLICYTAGDL